MGGGAGRKFFHNSFGEVSSFSNLLAAWQEFKRGKTHKTDVREFMFSLEDNLFRLREDLTTKTYRHGQYESFYIQDPKVRHIHKASVRDRVVHQAFFRVLYKIFNGSFIHDSYSCRIGKGTHRGVRRLEQFSRKVTRNWTRPAWILKCDIKKFFDSVDKSVLIKLISRKIQDPEMLWLTGRIVDSFGTSFGKGLPLGNVTSQLFANVYLNELDQFVKRELQEKYYIRYCDDFVLLNADREHLAAVVLYIQKFLRIHLKLDLHPRKIIFRKASWGTDFLGYVVLPHYTLLRTRTKKRMFKKIANKRVLMDNGSLKPDNFRHSLESYKGMLKHCKGYKLVQYIQQEYLID